MQFAREVGTLEDVMEYLQTHPTLFEKQQSEKGYIQRVMAVLTQQNMQLLEKQFQLYSRGLELPTFIYLMRQLYIPEHEISKYFFISDLIKFFQAIDINGDGHLQWSEFTEYIIENIRMIQKPKYNNKVFQENQIISTAYSKLQNQYQLKNVYDIRYHTFIKKIIFIIQSNQYYVIESQTHEIKIFNKKFIQQDIIVLQSNNNKNTIVDFSIDKENCVVGAIFEESLHFCNMKLKATVNFVNKQSSINYKQYSKIQYLKKHELWAIAHKSGEIKLAGVRYTSRTIMSFEMVKSLKYHESIITQIIEIDEPMFIASSSMDGLIKLYSKYLDKEYLFEHVMELAPSAINERKKKGVAGLSYSREFGNYLLAFGFSNYIYMHSLDISITKGYTGRYGEHSGTILWAKFLRTSPYVLSFDEKLALRIWDFRRFTTIQYINCERVLINPNYLQIIPQYNQILIGEKKIVQFKSTVLEQKSKEINQFHNIFDFKFCQFNNHIFVFTSNDVRVYNFYTGSLKKLFTKLYQTTCQTNITACQFGFKCRRFFVGDAGGYVREFCSQTGEELQSISPENELNYQNKQISKIIFLKEHSILICCSIDSRIMIYERDEEGGYTIIRDIRESHEELACVAASSRYCLLATAGQDGTITLWNLEKYVLESVSVVKSRPVGMAFSSIHPILIVLTEDGYLHLFYVPPFDGKQKYKCFARIWIRQVGGLNPIKATSFSCELIVNAYFPPKCSLNEKSKGKHHLLVAIGAQNGSIYVLNLNKILEIYNVEENHQINSMKNCHRCEVQVMKDVIEKQRNKIISAVQQNNIQNVHGVYQLVHMVIKASEDEIEHVLISKQCSSIMCKSRDKKLKIYNLKNEVHGIINFITFKKIYWKISWINYYKVLKLINNIIYSIKLIENKKFGQEEEYAVKVHLFINQYLNYQEKQEYFNWLDAKNNSNKQLSESEKIKYHVQQYNDKLNQLEFNKIYCKLKKSIQKSLQNFNYQKMLQKSKKLSYKQNQNIINLTNIQKYNQYSNNNDDYDRLQQYDKKRRKQNKSSFKIRNKTCIKFNTGFDIFKPKTQQNKDSVKKKRRNFLFTPLSIAKRKIIEGNTFSSFR